MEVILFCDGQARCIPGEPMPEALLPYCNMPLIARILRFLSGTAVTGVTLCRADPRTREFVESLPLRMELRWEVPERLKADSLVLHRLSLPDWDMGELSALCGNAPVRLLHPDGTETHAALCPAGSALCRPERTANVVLSVFDRADTPEQYLLLQQRMLERGAERLRIGQGTVFGKKAQADAATVIGNDCLIGEHAVLERCCLGDGVQIGAGAVLRDCVIGSRALADRQVQLSGRHIPADTVIAPQSDEPVTPELIVREEDGICRTLPRWNNAGTALQAGAAMTALGMRLVIGHSAAEGEAAALAAAAGAVSQGAQVWNAGCSALSQLIDLCGRVRADAILWVKGNAVLHLLPRMAGGFVPDSTQLRRLRQALAASVSTRIPECGKLRGASQLLPLWEDGIRSILPETMPCAVEVSCGDPHLRSTAESLFSGGTGQRIVLSLSEDGTKASAFTGDAGMLHHEQLLLLSLLSFRETGEALALPAEFHPAAEGFASRFGGRILRLHTPRTSPQAALLWQQQGVCMDGIRLFAHVLRVLAKRSLTLADAAALLPPMVTVRRMISTTLNAQAVESLRRENPDPAVQLVRPAFGSLARLLVHAADAETAAELCDFWETRIRARETAQCAESGRVLPDF